MRKIIVYIATSADGYIARLDGNIDWLTRPRFAGDYGMRAFYRSIDTILWGRKTYDVALEFQKQGIKGAAFDPKVKNYIFSHHPCDTHPHRRGHPPDRTAASRRAPTVAFMSALFRWGCSSPLFRSQAQTEKGPGQQRAA